MMEKCFIEIKRRLSDEGMDSFSSNDLITVLLATCLKVHHSHMQVFPIDTFIEHTGFLKELVVYIAEERF